MERFRGLYSNLWTVEASMIYTRRDFGKIGLAAVSASSMEATVPNSKIHGVQIGAITYSFRQGVPKPEIIPHMVKIGLSEVELMSGDAEALAGAPAVPDRPGRGETVTPERRAEIDAKQKSLTDWRASSKPAAFERVKQKFKEAGIDLRILCYNMNARIADDEIDYAFRMAQAMGVKAISSSSTVAVA